MRQTYLQNKNRLTDRKQTYGYQGGEGKGGTNQELGLTDNATIYKTDKQDAVEYSFLFCTAV